MAHKGGINAIDGFGGLVTNCGPPEFVTAGRDGYIKVWDPRQPKKPVAGVQPVVNEREGELPSDCWTVAFGNAFNNQERCVMAGFDNGDIRIFDLRKMKATWGINLGSGVCSLQFNKPNVPTTALVAATQRGSLNLFTKDPERTDKFKWNMTKDASGARNGGTRSTRTIWCVRHMPQCDDVFATCSGGGCVRIWSR